MKSLLNKIFVFLYVLCIAQSSLAEKEEKTVVIEIGRKKDIFDRLVFPGQVNSHAVAEVFSEVDGVVGETSSPIGSVLEKDDPVVKVLHMGGASSYRPYIVRTPFGGILTKLLTRKGAMVKRGQIVAKVVDPNEVIISMQVSSDLLKNIKTGLEGKAYFMGGNQGFSVKVASFSPIPDPTLGTSSVELVAIHKKDLGPERLGSIVKIEFEVNKRKSFALDEEVVLYEGSDAFIRVIDDSNTVKKKKIVIGKRYVGQVEIINGIQDDEKIIMKSSDHIREGDTVSVAKNKEGSD